MESGTDGTMTDGDSETPGKGPGDGDGSRGGGELPPDLRELHDELARARFDPPDGLEEEVVARISEARGGGRSASPGPASGRRRALRVAAVVLAGVALLGLLDRIGPGPGGGPEAAAPAPPAPGEDWALRWGPDARVLAVGRPAFRGSGTAARELRCGRVGGGLRCGGADLRPSAPATEGPAVLRDFCCLDYDGGGGADDGVRVVAGRRETVVDFWIYEDLDGTRSFSAGDLLRVVVPAVPSPGGGVGPRPGGLRRLDRCCADLDGGPRADDGLFVMAGGRERVALAVLYEDETGDGRLGPGDRLRAIRSEGGPPGRGEGVDGGR